MNVSFLYCRHRIPDTKERFHTVLSPSIRVKIAEAKNCSALKMERYLLQKFGWNYPSSRSPQKDLTLPSRSRVYDSFNLSHLILLKLWRLEEAERMLRKAIGVKPRYVSAMSNLGVTLQAMGKARTYRGNLVNVIM